MTSKEIQICKQQILKCLTEDFKGNRPIFDKHQGWQIFSETNLEMVMDSVVKGLKFAQHKLSNSDYAQCIDEIVEEFPPGESVCRSILEQIFEKHFA
jgi:hypothetical protein